MTFRENLPALAAAWLAVAPALSAQTGGAGTQDWRSRLASAIARAISANPELSAMEARIEAARQRALSANALPDPELEAGIKDVPVASPSLSRDDFTMEMLTARQSFPGSGKRAARRASAEAQAQSDAAMHGQHAVALAADVADTFFQLADLDRRMRILEESRERLKSAASSATERYRVGKGAQADVLRANLETTSLEDRLLSLRAERRSGAARFNALQNFPADAAVPPIGPIEPTGAAPDVRELTRRAEDESPSIAVARANVRRAEEQARLARLEARPDWMAMGYYARRERFEDLAGASVAISLPFLHPRRLAERRAESDAELSSAQAELSAARNRLRREIEEAAAELERNVEQARLFQTSIIPQAEINSRAAQEAYAVGQVDFLTFVRAALDLDNYRSELSMRTAGIGRAIAGLQRASGLPLIDGTPKPGEKHVEK